MLIIGDVHGKIAEYNKIIEKTNENSIQVGDFGFAKHHNWHLANIDSEKHKINFGNHDDYTFLNREHSLGDYCTIDNKYFTIRGANSIDKHLRKENFDYWTNEEINYSLWNQIIDNFIIFKPKIVVSHDCPQSIRNIVFGINNKSITSNGLQACFEAYQPELWIFGHHHKSISEHIEGTNFICLAELETITI